VQLYAWWLSGLIEQETKTDGDSAVATPDSHHQIDNEINWRLKLQMNNKAIRWSL